MTVTAIRQTSPAVCAVCLDEGGEIRSTPGVVTELRLYVGRELDEAGLETLRRESERALAREKALAAVSRRQMSRRELAGKLREKGFSPETVDYCVAWITERGFIDEESYAAAVVRHYAGKGFGAGRIRQELRRRGLPRDTEEAALAAAPEGSGRLERYIASHLRDPGDRDEVRKVSAALYRRGFAPEEIREALRRHEAESDFEE